MPDILEDLDLRDLLIEKATSTKSYAFQTLFEDEFKKRFYAIQTERDAKKEVPIRDRELAIYAAPGSGKTKMGAECLLTSATGIWLAHTDDLTDQALKQLKETCDAYGLPESAAAKLKFRNPKEIDTWIAAQKKLPEAERVKYAILSVPGVGRETQGDKLEKIISYLKTDCVVIDEAHHSIGERSKAVETKNLHMMDRISKAALEKGATILHLSATPVKRIDSDGKIVELDNASIIGSLGLRQAIRIGLLTEISTLKGLSLKDETANRNLKKEELADIFVERFLNPGVEELPLLRSMHTSLGLPEKHRTILFCPASKSAAIYIDEMAKVLEETYNRRRGTSKVPLVVAGISGGKSFILRNGLKTTCKRSKILDQYRKGEIDVICNYGVATEGVDLPQTTLLMLNRIAKSPVLGTQILGRLLRTLKGKSESFLFDHRFELGMRRIIVGLKTKIPMPGIPIKPAFYNGPVSPTARSATPVPAMSPMPVMPSSAPLGVYDRGIHAYLSNLRRKKNAMSPVTEREFVGLFMISSL